MVEICNYNSIIVKNIYMMTYNELLQQESWYEKCIEILHRDQYRCQKCGALGYHNNTYYECQTAGELDGFLKGILIKDSKPSVFIDKIKEEQSRNEFFIFSNGTDETTDMQTIGDKYLYDIHTTPDIHFWHILPTVSSKRIQDKKCIGSFIYKKDVIIPKETNFIYERGNYFFLNSSYFDNYIVRIEHRWPTGVGDDGYGPVFWGSVFISICYQNRCISLEFEDKTKIDDKGNYLETPIVPKALNVHHNYYVNGKNPWEYDNEALVTLCEDCHRDIHKSTTTPVYKELYGKQILRYAEICDRCGGRGFIPQYRHVMGGICFLCWGEGVITDPRDKDRYLNSHVKTSINS